MTEAEINKETKFHLNYYRTLDEDLDKLSRYIELSVDNFDTYSIELARIIMIATQEVDVIMKKLCKLLVPESSVSRIDQYKTIVKEHLPELINEPIFLKLHYIELNPWSLWAGETNPNWWRANNDIKHNRAEEFPKATLRNALDAVGGLLLVLIFYRRKLFIDNEIKNSEIDDVLLNFATDSSLLSMKREYYPTIIVAG